MPETAIKFFREDDGSVPVLEWLTNLAEQKPKAYSKCAYLLELLGQFGSELRRPRGDYLRNGVYELRTIVGNVNYRLLYGFVGKDVALLTASLSKEKKVPDKDIDLSIARIARYKSDPAKYGYEEEPGRGQDK